MFTLLQQFLDSERDFEDAVTVEEYIVEVDVFPDGTMVEAEGNVVAMEGSGVASQNQPGFSQCRADAVRIVCP